LNVEIEALNESMKENIKNELEYCKPKMLEAEFLEAVNLLYMNFRLRNRGE
jgi:hypothetical protein